jgi:ATP synthase protein I
MNVRHGDRHTGRSGFSMFFSSKDKSSGAMGVLGTVGTIGMQLVVATFIGLAMGYYLDKWLGTDPWMLIIFLLLGIVTGFRDVYREAMRLQRSSDEEGTGPGAGTR